MRFRVLFSLFLVASAVIPLSASAKKKKIRKTHSKESARKAYLEKSPLGDKIKIHHDYVKVSQQDQKTIQQGVDQRARALNELFKDLVLGESKILTKNGGFIPESYVRQIIASEFPFGWDYLKKIYKNKSAEQIGFLYAPDLMKIYHPLTGETVWSVIEDNIATQGDAVGGLGDTEYIRIKWIQSILTEYRFSSYEHKAVLREQLENYIRNNLGNLASDIKRLSDFLHQEYGSLDVSYPTLDQLLMLGINTGKSPNKDLERVRLYTLIEQYFGEPILEKQPDGSKFYANFSNYRGLTNIEIGLGIKDSDLYYHFLNESFSKDTFKSGMLISPGTEMLSSKAWGVWIDAIIFFYLKENPILFTPKTSFLKDLFWSSQNNKEYVFKRINGSGGSHIRFTWEMSDELIQHLISEQISSQSNPEADLYIVQERVLTAPNKNLAANMQFDIRPFHFVFKGGLKALTFESLWGRTSPIGSRNNVTQDAYELNVFTHSQLEAVKKCISFVLDTFSFPVR